MPSRVFADVWASFAVQSSWVAKKCHGQTCTKTVPVGLRFGFIYSNGRAFCKLLFLFLKNAKQAVTPNSSVIKWRA